MAITFPRTMILCGVRTIDFKIARYVSTNLLYGGKTQVREQAEPRWMATFSYAPMPRTEFQALQSWLDSLRGGLRDFYAFDPLKSLPVNYRSSGLPGGFGGTGTVSSVTVNGFTVSGLPSGFVLKAGDMVGLEEGAKRGLYRITEDATGASVALTVEPRVNTTLFSSAAVARVVRPVCVMTLDGESISDQRTAQIRNPITFSAIQKVY